ncbi:MAG: type II CAAX endopeptidase family protein [Cytophagales bacterium]|nr:type II CAAX endopeptidase family protein [Cytophagales bacterium]
MTKQHYPSIKQGFALILWYILFSIVAVIALMPLGIDAASGSSLGNFGYYVISMGLLAALGLKNSSREVPIVGDFTKMTWWAVLLLIPLVVLNIIVIDPLVSLIPMPDAFKELFEDLLKRDLFTFLTIVIAAPILEEFVFRGIVLEGFLKNYDAKKSIIWSAVLFGAVHLNPWQFIGAGILGAYIGWVYYRTRSLIPCIIIHMVNNLIAFLGFYYFPDIDSFQELSPSLTATLVALLGAVVSLIVVVKALDKGMPEAPIYMEEKEVMEEEVADLKE